VYAFFPIRIGHRELEAATDASGTAARQSSGPGREIVPAIRPQELGYRSASLTPVVMYDMFVVHERGVDSRAPAKPPAGHAEGGTWAGARRHETAAAIARLVPLRERSLQRRGPISRRARAPSSVIAWWVWPEVKSFVKPEASVDFLRRLECARGDLHPRANVWPARQQVRASGSVPWSQLHDLEVRNALRLLCGRKVLSTVELAAVLSQLEEDIDARRLLRVEVDWPAAFARAQALSEAHAAKVLSRSLDILHVGPGSRIEVHAFRVGGPPASASRAAWPGCGLWKLSPDREDHLEFP